MPHANNTGFTNPQYPSRTPIWVCFRRVLVDALGIPEDEANVDSSTNFPDWLRSVDRFDLFDLVDLWHRLNHFGLRASIIDFHSFFGGGADGKDEWEATVKPRLTFGAICDWLSARMPMPDYAPIEICGLSCRRAGAYLAIQEVVLAEGIKPKFGPSTQVRRVLRGSRLWRVWGQLRLHSGLRLPGLDYPLAVVGLGMMALGCFGLATSILAILSLAGGSPLAQLVFWTTFIAIGKVFSTCGNPLPPGIVTFKDLATALDATLSRDA